MRVFDSRIVMESIRARNDYPKSETEADWNVQDRIALAPLFKRGMTDCWGRDKYGAVMASPEHYEELVPNINQRESSMTDKTTLTAEDQTILDAVMRNGGLPDIVQSGKLPVEDFIALLKLSEEELNDYVAMVEKSRAEQENL